MVNRKSSESGQFKNSIPSKRGKPKLGYPVH